MENPLFQIFGIQNSSRHQFNPVFIKWRAELGVPPGACAMELNGRHVATMDKHPHTPPRPYTHFLRT